MKNNYLWIMLLGLFALSASVMAVPPPYTGVVSVDSTTVLPGAHFSLKVHFNNNNVPFAIMRVPLKFVSPALTLDSVTFSPVIADSGFGASYYADNVAKTVNLVILAPFESPVPTLNVVNLDFAEMFFHVATSPTPQVVPVDSINKDSLVVVLGDTVHITTRIEIADNTGSGSGVFFPGFNAGQVRILVPTSVNEDHNLLPSQFSLAQNYPNPFNPSTVISYSLPRSSQVLLEVFNVLGQKVVTLVNGRMEAGVHEVVFDALRQPSGIYFYRLTYDGGSDTKKMLLVK
ncbi:MAG TPA: T9SS type A sorting domain-containing protein [Candidatus Acidoferrum sp.]|nr:T9SS type A sorting domain-containing protein [Candidatus Acidoferrum sp.]